MAMVLLLLFIGGFVALLALGRRQREQRRAAAATVSLVVDDWGVKRTLADGRYEEVGWDELREIRATTLPRGPWDDRVRFVLDGGGERGCIVPSDVATDKGLVAAMSGLPGFDHRLLADVLDKPATGTQILWRRAAPSSA